MEESSYFCILMEHRVNIVRWGEMWILPAGNYVFKAKNRNARLRCEICLKLTTKTPEQRRSGVFIVNFEHISHHILVFLLLTLSR